MNLYNILNNLDKGEKVELARLLHHKLNVPDLNPKSTRKWMMRRPLC